MIVIYFITINLLKQHKCVFSFINLFRKAVTRWREQLMGASSGGCKILLSCWGGAIAKVDLVERACTVSRVTITMRRNRRFLLIFALIWAICVGYYIYKTGGSDVSNFCADISEDQTGIIDYRRSIQCVLCYLLGFCLRS